ncbi:hypothetical protein [Streptomyces sp. CRN 30]|uniref:hypothetical protein n=1 Tax=Streptomyces sp. CRN 30 TaxID=3075613 RepID=UPI002A7F7BC0|nr:hypothetical protein [Streptomyces sp. CRN 30]
MAGRSGTTKRAEPSYAAAVLRAAAALVLLLLALCVVRLPWIGDLGLHAATVERLRHDFVHPGNPLVDADTPSPYYSPWTLLLGVVAKATGASVFVVLRLGAAVALALLVTGVVRYVRTLSARPAAPPLALLCLLLLWGTRPFAWSGLLGLESLALTVAYPSVCATGLAFHLWAWAARGKWPGAVAAKYRVPWEGYGWITPWVRYGDVVMVRAGRGARQIPAYGAYTVAPGYPDFFLADERERTAAVRRYFAGDGEARREVLRSYRVRWVVAGEGTAPGGGLRRVARGPGGEVLYAVER